MKSMSLLCSVGLLASMSFVAYGGDLSSDAIESAIFFDDFAYANLDEFADNGWKVRTETGHPGISGASWSAAGISFLSDVKDSHNGIVRMSSVTAGEGDNTRHTQFCHKRT